MEKRTRAIATAALVVVVGAAVVFIVVPGLSTQFYIEASREDQTELILDIYGLEDTNLTVLFVDDESLYFSMSFIMYEPGANYQYQKAESHVDFRALARVREMELRIGSGGSGSWVSHHVPIIGFSS